MAKQKIKTSVSLDPEIAAYLDELAKQADRDRSWVVTTLVKEYKRLKEKFPAYKLPDPSAETVIPM